MLLFLGAILILLGTACSKESAEEKNVAIPKEAKQSKAELVKTNPTIVEGKQAYDPNNPPMNSSFLHVENRCKFVLSNSNTGITQIYWTILQRTPSSGPPPPPPPGTAPSVILPGPLSNPYPCSSISVSGIPGITGSTVLTNAVGLAIGNTPSLIDPGAWVYITTGSQSGVASNSLFCVDISTGTGFFVAKTRLNSVSGTIGTISDIECMSINAATAYGLANNQLATLNLTTGVYTTRALPNGIYSGLTILNNSTAAVFLPNHTSGITSGGYRTVDLTTFVASNIINWNVPNACWIVGDGGFANTPSQGLRWGNNYSTFPALSSLGTSTNPVSIHLEGTYNVVPVYDYSNY